MKSIPITHSPTGIRNPFARISILLFLFCCFLSAKTFATTVGVCMGTSPGAPSCASSFLAANPGGSWSSSNPSVGTIDPSTGVFTPLMPGTTTISYSGDGICGTYSYDITVHALPNPTISGPSSVCVASSITMTSDSAVGTWTSGDTSVATVGSSSGIVTGVAAGTAIISYTVANSYGCTFAATKVVTVLALPDATISGSTAVCVGQTIGLTAATGGGTWVSSNTSTATVSSSGIVTGVAGGTVTITYTVTNGDGCTNTDTHIVTVNSLPAAISGSSSVLVGFEITLSDATAGGTWSSSNTAVGTIGSTTGILRGIAEGVTTVTYTASTSCYTTKAISVNTLTICETAPVSMCDTVFTYCTNFTVEVGNVPTGDTVSWTPSIAAYSTRSCAGTVCTYTFTTAPPAGMYTVTATHGGFTTSKKVRFVVPVASNPCYYFSPLCPGMCSNKYPVKTVSPLSLAIDATQISATNPGVYFVTAPPSTFPDTLRVSPAPGSVIFLDKDRSLVIRAGDSIVLDSVHIISVDTFTLTNNITVIRSNSPMTKLRIINNSLIEYMDKAVIARGYWPSSAPDSGQYMVEISGAIFNRNNCDVFIDSTNAPSAYRFENSIFTNRRMCKYKLPGASNCDLYGNWPYVWPTVKNLRTVVNPGLNPQMVLDSFARIATNSIGIHLRKVGTTTIVGSDTAYNSIVVGDTLNADNYNIFDGKYNSSSYGIYVNESNAKIYNNIFRALNFGVHTFVVNKNLTLLGKAFSVVQTHNRFYNCTTAVNCNPCNTLVGRYAEISADNAKLTNNTIIKNEGQNGYFLRGRFNYYDIRYNTITNIENGVRSTQLDTGDVYVAHNTLKGIVTTGDSTYGVQGIQVSGLTSGTRPGTITVEDNNIYGYNTGISISSGVKLATVQNDTVILTDASPARNGDRTGIYISGKVRSVYHNHVYGDGTRVTYEKPASGTNNFGFKIDAGGTSADTCVVTCNYVHDVPTGFIFTQTNYVQWRNNVMARNKTGLRLYISTIGDQGSSCHPSDNVWAVTSGWPGWSGSGIAATSVTTVTPTASRLYVRSGASFTPPSNTADGGATAYSSGTTLLSASPCDSADSCSVFFTGGYYTASRFAPSGETPTIPGITKTQMDATTYTIFPNPAEDNISIQSSINSDAQVQITIRNYAAQVVYNGKQKLKNGLTNIKLPNAAAGMYMVTITDEKGQSHQFKLVMQGNSINTNRVGN